VLSIDEAKFNIGLDEKLFTPQALENSAHSENDKPAP
jgi:hypothetical protein